MKNLVFLLLLESLTFKNALSQEEDSKEKLINIQPTFGLTWRIGIMNFFNFGYKEPNFRGQPFLEERNTQGISYTPGIQLNSYPWNLGFEYQMGLRYDHLYHSYENSSCQLVQPNFCVFVPEYVKSFLVDHHFNIYKSIRWLSRKGNEKTYLLGIGITIVNAGKDYTVSGRTFDAQYTSYNIFVSIPILKQFYLEPKINYIPSGFPQNPSNELMSYSIRVYYRFNSQNR